MGQAFPGGATTAEAIRRAIQHSQESLGTRAKRLKTLNGRTSFEHICKCWTEEPNRFNVASNHFFPGLNT